MAEERFIDEDKDRKYRIRKNEKGEEELVVIDDEDEEEELPVYDVVTDEGEELTEEEAAQKAAERQQNIQKKVDAFKTTAREKMEEGDFESAQYALSQAADITEYDGELYYLQLKAFSRGMTNFLDLQKCLDASEGVREYSDEEQKNELLSLSAPLKARIEEFEEKSKSLKEENERGKEERRGTFVSNRKRALTVFACTAVPFVALFVLAIVFASMMFADQSGLYIVLTVAFGVATVAALIATLITLNKFLAANRKVKLNEMDTSTKVGRELISCNEELENLKKINSSFENDLS